MPCHSEGYILLCSLAFALLFPIVFYFCSSPFLYRNCNVWAKSESWGLLNRFSQGALPTPGSRCFSLGLPSLRDIQQLNLDSRLKTEDTKKKYLLGIVACHPVYRWSQIQVWWLQREPMKITRKAFISGTVLEELQREVLSSFSANKIWVAYKKLESATPKIF